MLSGRALACLAACLNVAAAPLRAQIYQGFVRDSVSGAAIPGVVVSAVDSAGRPVFRTLSGQDGAYRLMVPASATHLRVQRIGYRLRDLRITPSPDEETASLDIRLVALPSLLEPVRVFGTAACPRRRDNAQAQALYEQARAGLLATVVAREANPASVVRYLYDRPVTTWPDSAPVRLMIDSTQGTTTSFKTVFSGSELVQYGFKRRIGDQWQYAGPDAEVLLDEGFANGYCFSIANRDRSRRSQIGLSFAAADKQRGRVDIVGTLWIDTIARALRTIEYKYTGAEGLAQFLDTGGRTSFMEMPNGVVIVTQWSVRLLGQSVDSVTDGFGNRRAVRGIVQNEGGGYLARATWPDGTRWVAPMGTARLQLFLNDTTPLVATDIRLDRTDYHAASDSSGRVTFADLFPGRYRLTVRDTLIEELGWQPDVQWEFVSVPGDTINARIRVQSTAEQLLRKCVNKTSRAELVAVVNVKDAAVGAPDVRVELALDDKTVVEFTRQSGSLVFCFDRNALNGLVRVSGTRGDMQTQTIEHRLTRRVTLFRLQLAPKESARDAVPRDPY